MINPLLAYGQLIIGVPFMITAILLYVPNYLIEKIWQADNVSIYYYMVMSVLEGAISMLVSAYIFEYLHIESTIWIPVILQVVFVIWKMGRGEAFMLMFVTPGIVIGYKLFPFIRLYITQW